MAIIAAGAVVAGLLFPYAGGLGLISNKAVDAMESVSADLVSGVVPGVTTVTDVNGAPLAWLYDQYRVEVPSESISTDMKKAIISIEDRRFFEHKGVDWQGTGRAFITNFTTGEVRQGASTLNQQYVKNFQLLVTARTDAERRAATEQTSARKLREIRMATALDAELPKDEILTRYLNLVPFGNAAYGIEAAARTYFDVPAAELNVQQSALLAGLVQSTSALDPYRFPEKALARRNTVLSTMVETGAITDREGREASEQPLGVLPRPKNLGNGCITAGDRGFFCDYVIQYLAERGIPRQALLRDGYTIRTTLDPRVQDSVDRSLQTHASPNAVGVAEVMSVIKPGKESHDVLAIGSSRTYGLDVKAGQTVQPQPFSLVGDGAGSVFKIFTVAAAMEKGMGTSAVLAVPRRYNATGMGTGGAAGCPPNTYCVENAGAYPGRLSVPDLLAQSPNTTFVKLIGDAGVEDTVKMSVRLGMRSYTQPKTYGDQSIADFFSDNNLGSFTLGPAAVNGLELSNVAATLASGGVWCEPNPIAEIRDRKGEPVAINRQACERAVPEGLANTLANAMSKDTQGAGTAAAAAGASGWSLPMSAKTGTTEAHRSAAFLGFTNTLAGSVYAYNDSPTPSELCSGPLRQCGWGNLYGGMEPARTWFSAINPVARDFGPVALPPVDPAYVAGRGGVAVPDVIGLSEQEARSRLIAAGFKVQSMYVSKTGRPAGIVTGTDAGSSTIEGATVTLMVSDGTRPDPVITLPEIPDIPDIPDIPNLPNLPLPRPRR